jgi:RNA polymerase sigma-70 factor (sigma-E family)
VTFEDFAEQHLRRLLRFATVLTSDRGLGEEVVQDVLVRAYQQWDRIGGLADPYAYVRRMVVNERVSWLRKWARMVPTDVSYLAEEQSLVDAADAVSDRAALQGDIARLPRRQRAVIVLRYYENLTDQEIAEVLGCSSVTVRGYAMRGLRALRVAQTRQHDAEATGVRKPA